MFYDQFLRDFAALGRYLLQWLEGEISDHSLNNAVEAAARANPFFTPYMQRYAIASQARSFLDENELSRWLRSYFPADFRELGEDCRDNHGGKYSFGGFPRSALRIGLRKEGLSKNVI